MENCYRKLANAIILQAVKDYRKALNTKQWETVRTVERFFRSELFYSLTSINPEKLISKLRMEVKNK